MSVFEGSDACVAPVLSLNEAADHPHLRARGTVTHTGRGPVAAPAPRFSRTSTGPGAAARCPGLDTRTTLQSWGIDDIDDLVEAGAVVPDPEETAQETR